MTQQIIDTGLVANDGTGESLRNAFTSVNNNFANVWAAGPVDTQVIIYSNVVSTNVTNLDLRLAGNGIGTITVESTMVPSIDRVYDLGTPAKQYDSVYAQYYFGNGAFLTGISGGNGSVSNSFSTIDANGVNIVATSATDTLTFAPGNNIVILGNSGTDTVSISLVNNPVFSGNITAAGNIIGSNVNTVNLSLSGNVVSDLTVSGNVTAPYLLGNGSQLTGVVTSLGGNLAANINTGIYNLYSSNGAVKIDDSLSVTGTVITTGGILSGGPFTTTANVTANYFIGDGSQLTNLPAGNYSNANVAAYLPTYTGNVASGNVSAAGNIQGSYLLGNGSQLTGISTSLSGNLSGNINTGPYNLFSSNGAVKVDDSLSVTGTVTTTGGLITPGSIATTANVTANYFLGDGSQLTNLPPGNYSNANVAAYLPTYTGNVSANYFVGNGATLTSIAGANVLGAVANATYALNANSATYATSATQATYATVANSVAGANVLGTVANATYALNSNTSSYANVATVANSVAGANVTGTVANATYAITANSATYATYAVNTAQANYANIANSVTGANVLGIVANAAYATTSELANSANTAGTSQYVTANAQANITSVGVLTSLSSTGNITGNYILGNGSQLTGISTSLSGNLSGNINTGPYNLFSSNGAVIVNDSLSVTGTVTSTGGLITPGPVATTANVTANYFLGDGSQLTNLPAGNYSNANVAAYLPTYTGNIAAGNVSATGNIQSSYFVGNGSQLTGISASLSGNLSGNINTGPYNLFSSNGAVKVDDALSVTGTITTTGGLTSPGPIATTANVTANYFLGDGSQLTNLPAGNYSNANVAAYLPTYTGNVSAGNVSAAGNIQSSYFVGNGSQLTGISASLSGNLSGNINTGPYNLFSSNGAVVVNDALSVIGTVTTSGGMVSGGPIATTANVTANYFIGDGSQLTNLPAGNYSNANVAAYLPTYTGNVSANNFIGNGATLTSITGANVFGTVANATYALNANSATYATSATQATYATVANSVAGANVLGTVANATYALNSNTSSYTNQANIATVANSVAGANVTGTVANATYAITANSSTYTTYAVNANQANYANIANSVTGANVLGSVANAAYAIQSGLADSANTAGTAQYVTTAAQANITSVGILTSLSSTGNITGAYILGNGSQLTGIASSLNGNLTGNINTGPYNLFSSDGAVIVNDALSVTGTITTSGGIISSSPIATTANVTANYFLGDGSQLTNLPAGNYSNANVAAYLPTYTGNVSANNFIGNGATLTNIVGANIVGAVANATYALNANSAVYATNAIQATYANVANLVAGANVSGTVANATYALNANSAVYATQASIANVANLVTGANVVGTVANATYALNANAATYATNAVNSTQANYANIANSVTGANVVGIVANAAYATTASSANTANTAGLAQYVTANVQANITGVGVLTSLSSTGNITGAYVIGNGSQLTGVVKSLAGNLAGNIDTLEYSINSSNGEVRFGNSISVIGNAIVTDDLIVGDQIATTGNITTAANVYAQNFIGNVYGNIFANILVPGANTDVIFNTNGQADATSGLTFNKVSNVLTVGGNVSAGGNINANYFIGNGSQLTGIPESYGNANVAAYLPTYSGNLTANTISTTGNITGNSFIGITANLIGNITTSSNVIASYFVGNFAGNISGNLTVPGLNTQVIFNTDGSADATSGFTFDKVTNAVSIGGNATAVGNITASYFIGNGSQLTGIDATLIQNGNSNVKVNANANVTTSVNGVSNVLVVANTGAYVAGIASVTGNITGNNVNAVGLSLSGNVLSAINSASNITTTANIATGGILTDNYYYANGTPVDFEQPAGANTQIQFNDNNDFGATSAFTFDTAANALYVGGITSVTGNVNAGNLATAGLVAVDTITSYAANANVSIAPNGTGIVTIVDTDGGSTGIQLGTPTAGALVSNAVTLTTSTSVTNGIAQLNLILGKLVPPSPPNFPNATTITLSGITTYRMANITQVDNTPGANRAVASGTAVANVLRVATYATNTVSTVGPGDSGIVTAVRNGANVGNVTFNTGASPTANGTYGGNLVITNNYDYHVANASIAAGFWYVFSAAVSGTTAPAGWNELYIADSATGNTNTTVWYYDNSSPSAPSFSSTTMAPPGSANLLYSSTIPHYTNNNNFTIGFNVANVSGNTYPTSNTLASGSSGGAFAAPSSINYSASNIGSNVLNSFASASANTTVSVTTGFGGSSTGPSMSVNNSYSTGTLTLTTALGNTVLWKSGTATAVDEANVVIGSTIGTGSGNAFRIVNPGSGNTPAYTSNAAAFNSQTSTLETYDSTVVGSGSAGVLKHDQTNYATGYLPPGPNLSAGRTGTQYFTFKFVRTAVSKFDIRYTGTIAGMWVALPGSVIDSSSGANGWIDMSVAYGGAGYPGVTAPGNGSDGCAVGGTVTLNSAVTNSSKTCTFGTVSSSSTATNEIYVRIALTSGQSVTALTLQTASN